MTIIITSVDVIKKRMSH